MDDEYLNQRKRMLEEQIVRRGLNDAGLLQVMLRVPRHRFVALKDAGLAYSDFPLPIGEGQTISQPYIVALMTAMLQIKPGSKVLEVGTGSGYQAAVLAELASKVDTVEILPGLYQRAKVILQDLGYKNIQVHQGDGSVGWLEAAPFDAILVAASSPEVPQPLLDQLAEGGRLVAPVGSRGSQQLELWRKQDGMLMYEKKLAVAFVPLGGRYGWH